MHDRDSEVMVWLCAVYDDDDEDMVEDDNEVQEEGTEDECDSDEDDASDVSEDHEAAAPRHASPPSSELGPSGSHLLLLGPATCSYLTVGRVRLVEVSDYLAAPCSVTRAPQGLRRKKGAFLIPLSPLPNLAVVFRQPEALCSLPRAVSGTGLAGGRAGVAAQETALASFP